MSHELDEKVVAVPGSEPIVAISDPGEVDRAEHNGGDRAVVHVANVFSWIYPILMVAICSQVVLRGMGNNQAWLDDAQWWLYGAAVLIGIGYAVTTNSHVRVDIFYDGYAPAKQRKIDIFALSWLFLPFIILCWDVTLDYAISSVKAGEGSDSPNGLHGLYLLKVFMNVSFLFIAFAIWSAYVRYLAMITTPLWWRKLLYAFPAVAFVVNLAIYYAALGLVLATSEPGTTARQASRHWFFDTLVIGPEEMKYTIASALVVTIIIIAAAYVLRDKSEDAA
ncbi:TRAP-type mannitol/chloroaromatic compound transport system, small permease component [Jannaschia faecimaris]|uniref:TRAP transporter small permease protein n=1 Tax=Jannaschia faecimaris TaxID=1244108 RepID=A0A1H3QF55_9RHOB|nr:TRAP transporter small permease subunit [Jannaschia faecimaris]SDZ11940.1 TRAP-type mannitol/chloroaromatic compound transport system, small permease component [Jannaschia faecimaris]